MLRVYFMQQRYAMSDPAANDAPYEIESMRLFAGLKFIGDTLPDESTILRFRRLRERHALTQRMLDTINTALEERGVLFKDGTTVDATIIHAAPSTQNRAKTRNPEMHQTKKGNQWYIGMKTPAGADENSGSAHTVSVPPANAPDISEMPDLLREDDRATFGDAAYSCFGNSQAPKDSLWRCWARTAQSLLSSGSVTLPENHSRTGPHPPSLAGTCEDTRLIQYSTRGGWKIVPAAATSYN